MISNRILDIFYPPRCVICETVISAEKGHVCENCRGKLSYVEEPRCYKCGKEIESPDEEYCSDCSEKERSYVCGFPVFNYVSPISDSIMRLKYGGRQESAKFFAEEIFIKYGRQFKELGIDIIVPVPVHRKKYITRGYNQAELIAAELGRLMGLPVDPGLIIRVHDTKPQKKLDNLMRENNLKSAFKPGIINIEKKDIRNKNVEDLKILLVDDIYTTGATIEACTRVCRFMGINEVYFTSVAIGTGQ
ncbi:MAG: ComF family protein [Eubacterium sp.]|nr:ComF family protein [Eubacterium sp.]